MADDDLTGPWLLALGALAVGAGAVATEGLRRLRERTPARERDAGSAPDHEPDRD